MNCRNPKYIKAARGVPHSQKYIARLQKVRAYILFFLSKVESFQVYAIFMESCQVVQENVQYIELSHFFNHRAGGLMECAV